MDQMLSIHDHLKSVSKSSYMHLCNMVHMRKYLSEDSADTLIYALVTSRLDNVNALLYGLPDSSIHQLQESCMQEKIRSYDPIMISIHWLSVQCRIRYKILQLTHKREHGKAPQYLSSLLQMYVSKHSLRSSDLLLLQEKIMSLKTYGDRALSPCAPCLWSALPVDLRMCDTEDSFKNGLKTLLLKKAVNV